MKQKISLEDLNFNYADELIATEPSLEFNAVLVQLKGNDVDYASVSKENLFDEFNAGDCLVINNTHVLNRRIFTKDEFEILFLEELEDHSWKVLFNAKKVKVGQVIDLPGDVQMTLTEKGLPQTVKVNRHLKEEYFNKYGQLALPPYIQQARGQRQNVDGDKQWYQTAWAKEPGSFAAPTASLHFDKKDLETLKNKGVNVTEVTLHVGLGTFLPIHDDNLDNHKMHSEVGYVTASAFGEIQKAKEKNKKIWALGTTVTRVLESIPENKLKKDDQGNFFGSTDIFIKPGFEFKMIDALLTNFHQPKSTLLALVGAFAGLDNVFQVYDWAMKNKFKLFSYGDLTIWKK